MKLVFFLFLLCFLGNSFALDFKQIAFGDLKKGKAKIDLSESDFELHLPRTSLQIKSQLMKDSIQWVRLDDILLTPRARIGIMINGDAQDFHIRYRGQSILLQNYRKNSAYVQFFVSLFQPDDILIYYKGELIGPIKIKTVNKKRAKSHLIDYSCTKFNLKISGIQNDYITLGCKEEVVGKLGEERVILQVYFALSDYRLLDKSDPPYLINLSHNTPSTIVVQNKEGQKGEFKISAQLPPRFKRLRFAAGVGPYSYYSRSDDEEQRKGTALSFMLYGKFFYNQATSIKFFDAFIKKDSTFNNSGVYLSNDIAKFKDNRLVVNTLLGFQGLYFKPAHSSRVYNAMIFPQGLEVTLKHPFDLDNYLIVWGGFRSTISGVDYTNTWVRFGKRVFWELNYIDWGDGGNFIKTWGLSVGFPIGGLL